MLNSIPERIIFRDQNYYFFFVNGNNTCVCKFSKRKFCKLHKNIVFSSQKKNTFAKHFTLSNLRIHIKWNNMSTHLEYTRATLE